MAKYKCRYITDTGAAVEDVFELEAQKDIAAYMTQHGFKLISVEEEKASKSALSGLSSNRLKMKALVLFCRQMATLLESGIPLLQCFDIINGQTDDKLLQESLRQIKTSLQEGLLLSEAMEKLGDRFPSFIIKMVVVGEASGNMDTIMLKLADKYESDDKITRKVKGAMMYPLVLVGAAIGACILMLVLVLPGFETMYKEIGGELPGITKGMLAVSNLLRTRWYLFILAIIGIVIAIKRMLMDEKVQEQLDYQKLNFPLVKASIQKLMCEQLSSTLYLLLSSGIPIVQALEQTSDNMKNRYAKKCLNEVIIGTQQGKGISEQIKKYPVFPNLFVSMLAIGESSGNMNGMLQKVATYYKEETEAAIASLMSLIEPIMIILVGIPIAVMMLAIYLPMFSAITQV